MAHGIISIKELDWFSKNSYNVSIQHCQAGLPDLILRSVGTSIQVSTYELYLKARRTTLLTYH